MNKKINCVFNDQGAWCKHADVKRKWFIGARYCVEYNCTAECPLKLETPKPIKPPPAPTKPSKIIKEYAGDKCNVCGSSLEENHRNGCVQPLCANYYRGIVYKSEQYLSNLVDILYDYIPNHLPDDTKPKLQARVTGVYGTSNYGKTLTPPNPQLGMFDIQLMAVTQINEIGNSHLLGCNDTVIPLLVKEYGELRRIIGILLDEYKALKQFQGLQTYIPKFKLKDVNAALYDDLTQLTEAYALDCDIRSLVASL